ncbi:MAG: SWIM zinc finger family protein [Desulfobacterales bacterium]|jgi:uncharacterized Zn finger protein|nr:SWIM zinc finger family protein [Desulfobacterales bacterium]
MLELSREYIQTEVADSAFIYKRGQALFEHGAFMMTSADPEKECFTYRVDGNYGDYTIQIQLLADCVKSSCDCPYPGDGCKHTVAALLDARNILSDFKRIPKGKTKDFVEVEGDFLTPDEIRAQAIEDRKKRAKNEIFNVTLGDMMKGEHLVETEIGKQYTVTFHDPLSEAGHCTCPDFLTNRLGTCKHLIHVAQRLKKLPGFAKRSAAE